MLLAVVASAYPPFPSLPALHQPLTEEHCRVFASMPRLPIIPHVFADEQQESCLSRYLNGKSLSCGDGKGCKELRREKNEWEKTFFFFFLSRKMVLLLQLCFEVLHFSLQ